MNARSTTLIFALCGLAWAVIVARAYLTAKDADDFVITISQSEVQAFAREQLGPLQQSSFSDDIELCGIIFERSDGSLGASEPRNGDEASCGIAYFDEPGMRPVASFHTHAAQNDKYDSEVPSVLDIDSDVASGMDGYVATPGGRFWHINAQNGEAMMVCGVGCLDQDPAYAPCPANEPDTFYTRSDLVARTRTPFSTC